MLKTKLLEIRDRNTFIPAIAIEMISRPLLGDSSVSSLTQCDTTSDHEARRYLLRRAGYADDERHPTILLTHLDGGRVAQCDVYAWGDRTWKVAHHYIEQHWHDLKDGDVICVEHILGERATPKVSERVEAGLS